MTMRKKDDDVDDDDEGDDDDPYCLIHKVIRNRRAHIRKRNTLLYDVRWHSAHSTLIIRVSPGIHGFRW